MAPVKNLITPLIITMWFEYPIIWWEDYLLFSEEPKYIHNQYDYIYFFLIMRNIVTANSPSGGHVYVQIKWIFVFMYRCMFLKTNKESGNCMIDLQTFIVRISSLYLFLQRHNLHNFGIHVAISEVNRISKW